jgi:hypothetical protein
MHVHYLVMKQNYIIIISGVFEDTAILNSHLKQEKFNENLNFVAYQT